MALPRVRLTDILLHDGHPSGKYLAAIKSLSCSLTRHNAVIIELGSNDAAMLKCGLEATRSHFRSQIQSGSSRGICTYHAGRDTTDCDSPPCMAEAYKRMGRVARASLSAIAKHLRLRSDAFDHLLDDIPLAVDEHSSSVLVATYSQPSRQQEKIALNVDVVKGLLALIASDFPGIQVCDSDGRWFHADQKLASGDLILITGKALSHVTGGLRAAAPYRLNIELPPGETTVGRSSLMFKLMPRDNAILDCSPVMAAGHVIPESFAPVSASQLTNDITATDDLTCDIQDDTTISRANVIKGPSLRSVLSDPLSGAFLEDAMVVSCGHSFGGLMLEKVLDMEKCPLCNEEIDADSLIPNFALRTASAVVKSEDERRLFHNVSTRKRRRDSGDQNDFQKTTNKTESVGIDGSNRGVQYPFSVNDKVMIVGNRRTPEKYIGKEATIASLCLNGWYLVTVCDTGESLRLQYRSLRKIYCPQPIQNIRAADSVKRSPPP